MTTNASTLAGGLPGAGGRITPAAALRHWLLVGRRDLLQVRSNPQLLIFVLIQPILFVTRAELLRELGHPDRARAADRLALELTANPAEQAVLHQRLTWT